MLIFWLVIIPLIYSFIKLIIYFIVYKFGKFSFDGMTIAGFKYNPQKDIFYATKNAWQKNFGYSHLYDVGAPLFWMIVDTEPIRFSYNNQNWLLSFWKGQYGIVTGAEIGIYKTHDREVNKRTLYLPVDDNEMLDMSFKLWKKGQEIMQIEAHHWWLAAFKLGMFSKPKDLTMQITIKFPNSEMLNAFLKAFKKKGYKEKNYQVYENTLNFTFQKPKTHRVWTRNWLYASIIQHLNHKNVKLYNKYLIDAIDNNQIDDGKIDSHLIMLKDIIPEILKGEFNNNDTKTLKRIIRTSKNNILLLKEDIYSDLRKREHE